METSKKFITAILISGLLMTGLGSMAQFIRSRPTGVVTAFSATPDGKYIALGSKFSIEVINSERGEPVLSKSNLRDVKSLDLSKDGRSLAISLDKRDASANLYYCDIITGSLNTIPHTHLDKILTVAFSHDGKLIATGSADRTIKVFDVKTLKEIGSLKGHDKSITCLEFSPDNNFLLSGSEDKTMILWDLQKFVDVFNYKGHQRRINTVAISPDSRFLASGGDDNLIFVWDIYKPEKPYTIIEGHALGVTSIEFSPDGKFLGSGSKDYRFFIWDFNNSRKLNLNFGIGLNHKGSVNFISFVENGRIYTCSSDMTVKLWNWGFPVLEVSNFHISDKNNNGKIEGSEEIKIKFSIENTGEGSATRLKFNINETRNIEGLTFPREFMVNEIPAKSVHEISIPVMTSSKLKNAFAKFAFTDFSVICNFPFPLNDTSFTVETVATPLLEIDSVYFVKSDTSSFLTGNETGVFKIHLRNSGVGMANRVKVAVSCDKPEAGISYEKQIDFGNISTNSSLALPVSVTGTQKIEDGLAIFRFEITDATNISIVSTTYQLKTKKYEPTLIEDIRNIVEQKINVWQKKGKWEQAEAYQDRVTEKTRETQIALFTQQVMDSLVNKELNWSLATNIYDTESEVFEISLPKFDPFYLKVPLSEAPDFDKKFKQLKIGDISYTVSENMKNFAFLHVELIDTLAQNRTYQINSSESVAFNTRVFNFNFDPINVSIATNPSASKNGQIVNYSLGKSDVDRNIPEVTIKNPNVFAVIIGNEDYSSRQKGLNTERNVDFAVNDAITFKNYLLNTYGVPSDNISLITDATAAEIDRGIKWLKSLAENKKGQAELVFYFSGHGLPDEQSREGYIMPVDVTGTDIQFAIKLSYLYAELSKYPTKKVTIILDACFSGGGRTEGLVAMKGAKIKPKEEVISGNMVVLTSSSGDESSGFYLEKQHGMFTYFLLKKIQETNGEVDYQSLIDYLKEKVNMQSLISNFKYQNPQIIISDDLSIPLNTIRLGSNIQSSPEQMNQK